MDAAASAASVAAAANAANLSHGRPQQQDPPRMRSSIACWRCRRSKVKCLNNGVNTPCRACVTANRECTYPSPSVGDRSQRRDGRDDRGIMDGMGLDTPRSSRSKPKKHAGYGTSSSMRSLLDALDPSILTPQVWLDLFEIWQCHYAGDLTFLHPPTFQTILRQARPAPTTLQDFATPPKMGMDSREQLLPGLSPEFLLAFLALTSKFHPALIAHHSPSTSTRPSNPLLAADYYAAACKERLQRASYPPLTLKDVNLARCQAHLMLAMHEWGSCQGLAAWSDLDAAKRYTQLLGLQYLDTAKESNILKSAAVKAVASGQPAPASAEDVLIEEEAKRRTLWSCFALERCMSSGIFRPVELESLNIGTQLPCSERAFLFGENVLTKLLIETVDASQRGEKKASTPAYSPLNFLSRSKERNEDLVDEIGVREPAISRYIRALDTFNAVIQYAGAGGRLLEHHAPWETESKWNALYKAVGQIEKLPRDLTLSPANISAHHSTRTLSSFLLLHTTILLSKIILHREWIPFLGIRCNTPSGPSDTESPFMAGAKADPAKFRVGFWSESAGELFETAAQLLSLLSQCAEYQALVETPLVGFAAYMVALVGIYSTHFPWMDAREHMSINPASSTGHSGLVSMFFQRDASRARKAIDLLIKFRPKLRQASEQMQVLARLHSYYLKMKQELRRNYKNFNPFSPEETYKGKQTLMPLRMGEEEYGVLDAVLSGDLGGDTEMVDAPPMQQSTPSGGADESLGLLGTPTPSATEGASRWPAVNITGGQQALPSISSNGAAPGSGSGSGSGYPGTPSGAASIQPFTPPPMPAVKPPVAVRSEPDPPVASTSTSATVNWTPDQVEAWLDGLETVFTGSDIVGWAEGKSWREDAVLAGGEAGWGRDWRRLL